jgi:hypothetical protein
VLGHGPFVLALGSGICSALGLLQLVVFADGIGARPWVALVAALRSPGPTARRLPHPGSASPWLRPAGCS